MSELQKIIAKLWEAESEAKVLVEKSKQQAESLFKKTEEDFANKRSLKLEEANREAQKRLQEAEQEAKEEAKMFLIQAEAKRAKQKQIFEHRLAEVVEGTVAECIRKYKSRVTG